MNGIFDKDGHITQRGFSLLTAGEPDELTRYELAEHLDFCDLCVDRYSLLLCGGGLMVPREEIAEPVMAKIRRKALMVFTGQAAKVCAAACLAIVIWCGGIFEGDIVAKGRSFSEQVSKSGSSLSQMMSGVSDSIGSWLNGFSIYSRGEGFGAEKQQSE